MKNEIAVSRLTLNKESYVAKPGRSWAVGDDRHGTLVPP